ncbi:hypothetical protein [Pseudomonas defluvii]|uniref:hypothetical protein n=1 Tax=Pseudomonas defluvii TaxID=1876757 RepID=UPI00390691AC
MQIDIRRAPTYNSASLPAETPSFFVVSARKFSIMMALTLGYYLLYWTYANWRRFKKASGQSIMPFWRTLFMPFFHYSLVMHVDKKIVGMRRQFNWSPGLLAIASIFIWCLSLLPVEVPLEGLFKLVLLLTVQIGLLVRVQHAINFCEGDPRGDGNSALTFANWLWIFIGLIQWLGIIASVLLIHGYDFYDFGIYD